MGKYTHIWEQQCTRILNALKGGKAEWTLSPELFENTGNRDNSGYSFSKVVFVNGICSQELSGSAVARNLRDVVASVAQQNRHLFKGKTVTMKMNKSFVFNIEYYGGGENISKIANTLPKLAAESTSSQKISSFPPIVDEKSKILVLGTMPGKDSLAAGEYYTNKNNIFWNIICNIFNKEMRFSTYKEKIECLKNNHIAVWDVLQHCQREGSVDETITEEKYNDIDNFLIQYPNIKKIVFNGQKPYSYYKSYCKLYNKRLSVQCKIALSTSPANRQYSDEERIDSWIQALGQ